MIQLKIILPGYINLLKTSMGSGILAFPHLFKTYGIIPTIILTLISAAFSFVGLLIYSECCLHVNKPTNLSLLTKKSVPHASLLVNLAIFMKCVGVSISYLVIAKQIIKTILPNYYKSAFLFYFTCTAPICFFKELKKLKYTSSLGLISIMIVVVLSFAKFYTNPHISVTPSFSMEQTTGLGKLVFAFTCHMNLFTVFSELPSTSYKNIRVIITSVVATAAVIYILFGYFSFAVYGTSIKDNILQNYTNKGSGLISKLLYLIVMAVSYPLQINPARLYLKNMIKINGLISDTMENILITVMIICVTSFIAFRVSLGLIYIVIGATSSTFICLMLPTMIYLNLEEVEKKKIFLVLLGYCAFIFGVFVFAISLIGIFSQL